MPIEVKTTCAKEEHSYELPAIYPTHFLSGTSEYNDWIIKNSTVD